MATFSEVKGHNTALIRKILEMSIFIKPVEEGDEEVTAIHDSTGVLVPVGYEPVGLITKDDGASWTREQENSEVTSMGYAQPTRIDIISDVSGLSFTMQESKRQAMEMYHGLDLSAVTTDADGNFFFDRASRPEVRRYRVLAVGKDGDGAGAIYVARWLPNAQVTENAEQAWNEGTEVQYPATLTGFLDDEFGTAFREIWGGPGLDHEAMGFQAPTP